MEKNITLQSGNRAPFGGAAFSPETAIGSIKSIASTIAVDIKRTAAMPVEWLRKYYSGVLGRKVSMGQTLRYLHAQAAFILAVFPAYDSMLAHAVVAMWAAVAVAKCTEK